MNNFDRRHVEKMTGPFGPNLTVNSHPAVIAKAHAASIALIIKSASDSVVSELDSIDQRLGQVLVGLDQLRRIVDKLDDISTRLDKLEVTG
jgi:hypothetical protein